MDSILLRPLLIIIGILLTTFLTIYFLWPSGFFRLFVWCGQQINGVQVRYANHNGYRFSYLTRGKPGLQPSILMLHGFTLKKDSWLITLCFFPKNLHVVCVDLPGHGETSRLPEDNYTASDQAKRIHQFVECIGLNIKPFHLIGISLGGLIAGVYAALYPSDVFCMSLLAPVGLRYQRESEAAKRLKKLKTNPDADMIFTPVNIQQLQDLLSLGVYHHIKIPQQIMKGYLEEQIPDNDFFRKCFFDFTREESLYSLHDNMSKIRAPTQVIWGKNDRMIESCGAAVLAQGIPNARVHILENCGHCIALDFPKKSAELLLDFHTSCFLWNE